MKHQLLPQQLWIPVAEARTFLPTLWLVGSTTLLKKMLLHRWFTKLKHWRCSIVQQQALWMWLDWSKLPVLQLVINLQLPQQCRGLPLIPHQWQLPLAVQVVQLILWLLLVPQVFQQWVPQLTVLDILYWHKAMATRSNWPMLVTIQHCLTQDLLQRWMAHIKILKEIYTFQIGLRWSTQPVPQHPLCCQPREDYGITVL